jgi:hypothetical protein
MKSKIHKTISFAISLCSFVMSAQALAPDEEQLPFPMTAEVRTSVKDPMCNIFKTIMLNLAKATHLPVGQNEEPVRITGKSLFRRRVTDTRDRTLALQKFIPSEIEEINGRYQGPWGNVLEIRDDGATIDLFEPEFNIELEGYGTLKFSDTWLAGILVGNNPFKGALQVQYPEHQKYESLVSTLRDLSGGTVPATEEKRRILENIFLRKVKARIVEEWTVIKIHDSTGGGIVLVNTSHGNGPGFAQVVLWVPPAG